QQWNVEHKAVSEARLIQRKPFHACRDKYQASDQFGMLEREIRGDTSSQVKINMNNANTVRMSLLCFLMLYCTHVEH
ncbi:MAG: hypothetical protein ABI406_09865, partial [Ktedonobacteraceae bacterium]